MPKLYTHGPTLELEGTVEVELAVQEGLLQNSIANLRLMARCASVWSVAQQQQSAEIPCACRCSCLGGALARCQTKSTTRLFSGILAKCQTRNSRRTPRCRIGCMFLNVTTSRTSASSTRQAWVNECVIMLVCGQRYSAVSWHRGRANPPPKLCRRIQKCCKAVELSGGDLRTLVGNGYAAERPKELLPQRERLSSQWIQTDISGLLPRAAVKDEGDGKNGWKHVRAYTMFSTRCEPSSVLDLQYYIFSTIC